MAKEQRKTVKDYLLQGGIQGKTFTNSRGEGYTVKGIKKGGKKFLKVYLEIEERNIHKPLVDSLDDLEVSASRYRSLRAQEITKHIKKPISQTLLELRADEEADLF